MSDIATVNATAPADAHASTAAPPDASADPVSPLRGNPGVVGVPAVITGALGFGLINIGALPGGAVGATLAIIAPCTVVGLLISTIWAAALGQNASASMFGVFFGFYASYSVLALGLAHGWFGAVAATDAQLAWMVCWLVTLLTVTLVTLRLPSSLTLLMCLGDIALALLIAGTATGSTSLIRVCGVVVFAFVALAIYLYADLMLTETGGCGLPLGRPLVGN